ncbi:hypothetical protein ACVWWO_002058 [Bradyrhizobium sp. F1.13.1]
MLRSFIMTALALGWGSSSALSLTSEEIIAKLRAAGYSHIQELPAGKIKTYKAVKEGTARWHRDRDPAKSRRAVKEYLATLNDTAWGAASDVVPKFISPSDPAAQWTGAHKGAAFFAYSDNYLIDVKFGVIVDVEASRAIRQAEVGAAKTIVERTEERFGLKPERLIGDTAYGAAPMLNWLVEEKGIGPHIPVFDKSKRMTVPSRRATFDMTRPATSITARVVSGLGQAVPCMKARRCCIEQASSTAMYARLNRSAVQKNRRARSRATSMNTPETLPGRLPTPKTLRSHDVSARRSRCGSHI